MKGDDSLDSARTYSLVLVVMAYVGLTLAGGTLRGISTLVLARRAFAAKALGEHPLDDGVNSFDVPGVGSVDAVPPLKDRSNPLGLEDSTRAGLDFNHRRFAVKTPSGRFWALYVDYDRRSFETASEEDLRSVAFSHGLSVAPAATRGELIKAVQNHLAEKDAAAVEQLREIALDLDLKPSETGDYAETFHLVERRLLEDAVKVPLLELEFRPDVAAWVLAVASVGILIVIANQLRRVTLDDDAAIEKPWLVLDAQSLPEKVAALVWCAALLLAPWAAIACPIIVYASHVIADGAVNAPLGDGLAIGSLALLLAASLWSCLEVVRALIVIRETRMQRLGVLSAGAA